MGLQEAVWARNQNYMAVVKSLTFSKMPWYDMHAFPDEENHMQKAAQRLIVDNASESASDNEGELASDAGCQAELIQVAFFVPLRH